MIPSSNVFGDSSAVRISGPMPDRCRNAGVEFNIRFCCSPTNNRQFLRIVFCFLATLPWHFLRVTPHVGRDGYRTGYHDGDEFSISVEQVIDNFLPNRLETKCPTDSPDVVFTSSPIRCACSLSEYGVFAFTPCFTWGCGVAHLPLFRLTCGCLLYFYGTGFILWFHRLTQAIAMGWTMLAYPFIQRKTLFTFFVLGDAVSQVGTGLFRAYFTHRRIGLSFVLILCAVAFISFPMPTICPVIVQYLGKFDDRVEDILVVLTKN